MMRSPSGAILSPLRAASASLGRPWLQ
jgi:hypothetical protein